MEEGRRGILACGTKILLSLPNNHCQIIGQGAVEAETERRNGPSSRDPAPHV
jgi:hypothetical protein